jgi:DNA-binding XRE family transcriptional regulator
MEDMQYTQRLSTRRVRFPNAIRVYRLQAGLSQKHLATMVGHTRSMVSAWERGQTLPTLIHAFELARALDTLTEALYKTLYRPENSRA